MAYFKHNRIRTEDRTLCNLQTDKLHNHDCKEEERLWKVTSPSRASEPERDRHARKCSCHLVSHGSSPAQLSHHCCGCVSGYRSATSSFHDDYVDGKQTFDVSCAITKTLGSSVMHIRKNVQLFTFVDILITLHSGKLHPWSLQFVAHPCSMSLNLSKYSIAMLKSSIWRINFVHLRRPSRLFTQLPVSSLKFQSCERYASYFFISFTAISLKYFMKKWTVCLQQLPHFDFI